ncbi:MAG: DUF1109 domain-containing protein [Alphaproteobacteria bacterium]|nr:DUF1109 domain-containing protein [Alphaproteobacteria bacterium]
MSTERLIEALVADRDTPTITPARAVWWSVAAGGVVAAIGFFLVLDVRPDLAAVLLSWRFLTKAAFVFALIGVAIGEVVARSRPDARPDLRTWTLLPVAVLIAGIGGEVATQPAADLLGLGHGMHPITCLFFIAGLAAPVFVALLVALRWTAPASPSACGAAAGVLAGAIGAALYSLYCTDDSPLFLATWYVLALMPLGLLGALFGGRLLRW